MSNEHALWALKAEPSRPSFSKMSTSQLDDSTTMAHLESNPQLDITSGFMRRVFLWFGNEENSSITVIFLGSQSSC